MLYCEALLVKTEVREGSYRSRHNCTEKILNAQPCGVGYCRTQHTQQLAAVLGKCTCTGCNIQMVATASIMSHHESSLQWHHCSIGFLESPCTPQHHCTAMAQMLHCMQLAATDAFTRLVPIHQPRNDSMPQMQSLQRSGTLEVRLHRTGSPAFSAATSSGALRRPRPPHS